MSRPSDESVTNILLLGQTGVGKSTFINAFANYLSYRTLDSALREEMVTLIPASFVLADPVTYRVTNVVVGPSNVNECYNDRGESNTRGCQSYRFIIGNRSVRLIDTPGVGDTRGLVQDNLNFEHILAYISQYKYLHGICILLKPDEQRLNNLFRFCTTELLTHLHKSARKNIMFLFTNSRNTFYSPGQSVVMLRVLLDDLEKATGVEIPFSNSNTFCLDNEPFRFLAASKSNIKFPPAQKEDYARSWEKSGEELMKLFSLMMEYKPHDVQETLSVNKAQQLIRKLSRPMTEVLRLIEENKQLAEQYEDQGRKGRSQEQRGMNAIPQKSARVVKLDEPCTVCTSEQCTSVKHIGGEVKVTYDTVCHPDCRLRGIEQEVANDPALLYCKTIDMKTECCKKCDCHYAFHMHITYRYEEYTTYIDMNMNQAGQQRGTSSSRSTMSFEDWLTSIRHRIENMKREEQVIMDTAAKLSAYLHENSISPYNDAMSEYLKILIRAEEARQAADGHNEKVVENLRRLAKQHKRDVDFLKKNKPKLNMNDRIALKTSESTMQETRDVFFLIEKLYELPICGSMIREQVEGLSRSERNKTFEKDISVTIRLHESRSALAREIDQQSSRTRERDRQSSRTRERDRQSSRTRERDRQSSRTRERDRQSSRTSERDLQPSRTRERDQQSSSTVVTSI